MQQPSLFELRRKDGTVIGQGLCWSDSAATLRMVNADAFTDSDILHFEDVSTVFDMYRHTDVSPKFL